MAEVKIEHVRKAYGQKVVYKDLNLTINDGECFTLLGPSGCGKTVMLRMIAGFESPDAGTIKIGGVMQSSPADKIMVPPDERSLGVVFQDYAVWPHMTVKENVLVARTHLYRESFIGTMLRLPQFYQQEAAVATAADELLDFFELADVADEPTASLPYGTQRRVEIVRAVATKPQLLFLDEPAAGMNPEETADLGRLITRIREHFGITVVLIEHDMSLVMKLAESIYVLDHGAMIASGTPNEIQTNAQVISAYLGGENHA